MHKRSQAHSRSSITSAPAQEHLWDREGLAAQMSCLAQMLPPSGTFIPIFHSYHPSSSTHSLLTSSNQWSQHQMTTWPARDAMGDSGQVSNRDCWGLQKNFNKCILSRRKQGIRVATICHCFHYFFVIPEETLSLNFHPKYQQLATNLNSKCCVVSTRHRYSEDFISGVFRV